MAPELEQAIRNAAQVSLLFALKGRNERVEASLKSGEITYHRVMRGANVDTITDIDALEEKLNRES